MATAEITPPEAPAVRKKLFGLPIDTMLLVVIGALAAFGLMMVYSSTFDWSYRQYGDAGLVFRRQVQWLILGLGAMGVTALIPYRLWRPGALVLMVITLVALVAVLIFGATTFNATRSFLAGSYQPSELAKLATIIYLAVWLDSKKDRLHQMSYGLFPFAVIVGLLAGLILLQPDLSAAFTVIIVAALLFFIAGADILQMALVTALGAPITWAVMQVSATGRQRVTDFVAGLQDMTQASWHVQQAAVAFVHGGWFGRGLGKSHQKFGFLPTPHTDSIFAIIGEELGVAGCLVVIGLFIVLAWRGFRIAAQAQDQLGALLAAGIVCWISAEALINIAVMVGAMPFAGNALPFISYGGSSMLVTMTGMGILLSVSRRDDSQPIPRKTRSTVAARRGVIGARLNATSDFGRRNRRRSLPRAGNSESSH
jgi:cell division protein FtsW